ncbi:MAG TPA: hypothetical protein VGQ11_12515 [Candidatus Acidoferrales bacterium]|jgi:hypothetical protein|nr:hypothetical protein [Candidatus Acidoferrales bacterium]
MAQREKEISIPVSILLSVTTVDELEDWLQARDPEFIAEMRRIRAEDLAGCKSYTTDELRKEWNIPS